MTIPLLPRPHLSFNEDGTARASLDVPNLNHAGPSKHRSSDIKAPELDSRPYERELTKREKAAVCICIACQWMLRSLIELILFPLNQQPKTATTSELWATLPTARVDVLPQMKRDYQALALANSLDPKRFMKGGNKAGKIPESFAVSFGFLCTQTRNLLQNKT